MTSRKQLAINQRALYDDAVKNKMFWNATPSFQEFQRRLQNPKYVQTVQANYRAHGRSGDAFDTLSGFRDYFCVSDEDKQDMTQGVGNMIANTKARLAGQQRYNKLKQHQDKQRGRYGRLDLGVKNPLTNDNVVRDDATGTYLTSQGAEYAQEYEAARAQNHIDETGKRYTEAVERGDLPSAFEVRDEDGNYALMEDLGVKPGVHVTEKGKQQQLAGLVNTRKNVEEQYNALYRKLEEDFKRSAPFSINTHSQYGIDDNNMRLQAYLNSNAQYRRLKAQLHQLDNAIGVGKEAVKGRAEERYVKNAKGMLGYAYRDLKSFGASALRGLWNAVSDVSTWDMGLQDLQDNMTLYTTVKKARQKGYKNLNSEERQMLDVAAKTGAYTAENQQYLGRGYKAGNVTGESLPFMVEMALNPASGLGEAVMSKYMRNAIAKYGKEAVRKEAWKYVTKKCGYRIAGDVLGAALMTGTTGSARTLADTYDRLTGDIKSTHDSNGKIVYDGTENEEKGILKAYLKAFGATAIENHSEFVGEYFNPLLKGVGTLTMKGWKKVNAKSANAFLDNLKDMGSTSTAKWLGNLFDKTQWHGTIGEYAEEVVGNIENALLVGDSTLDTKEGTGVFNLDQNIDTFLGVSLMGGFFSTLKTGAYVRDKVKGERKILMQQSLDLDNSIRYALGADPRLADKWKEWRVALAQGTDEEKKQALKEISENTNGNIKKAMYDYSANAQKLAGMDKATQGAIEDGTITPEQAQRDADIEQAHEEGLAAEGTARHDIQQEHQLRENSLARMLGISAEQLDRMEDEDIESMTGQNDALDTAIYDYQTSRERYQGVIDRATDEVEQAGIDAAHQIDLYTDHSTGQIRPCVIKGNNGKEDYQGYIVNGNIATHPDGAIDVSGSDKMILYFDPETGKIEHGDASTFASLGESADATVARQQAIDEAKQQAAQAQSRDIDGGVGEDGNVSEAMPTFPQSSDHEERNAADFDIGQVVNAETGEVIPVSFEGLAEGENAYLTGGRPDGKTKDRLKVTIVDAEGNVTNRVMKRGNVQVDGRMSAEDFRNAYEEAVSSRMAPEADINGQENNVDEEGVVAGDAAPSADKAATSEEEGAASEPAVRDKNGNPIYDKMPISATIADLYDGALDDAEIDGFVSAQIAEAEKAVEKMEKKKPKVGTDKAKYLADKKAWEEGLQEAQRKVQYWQDVKAEVEKITTPEDARGYEEELNGDAAQTAYRNGSDAAAYGAREVTAEFMQSGDVKITPESYRKETGFGAAEQRAMVGKISKGGKSIDKLAEDLEVFDRENYNGMYFGGDSSVAKDAILDYLSSPDSRKGVKKMQSEAEREYVEAYEAERDRYYQEKYHMSYEEYLVYSSQEMPELLRKYSNFDEQLFLERYADEIEAALQKREEQLKQEENGKEGNVSAGEESGHGRSNQVQSGERTDDTGRGEVGKDSAGEVGPRHEGVVESEAASKETITPEQQSLLSRPNSSQYTAERESSDHKATNNTDTKQGNEEKSAKALSNKQSSGQAKMSHKEKTGEKEAMSPTPAMIDRMIEEQRVDDVSELLISSELKKAAEGIAEAFGMKVVYLKKVFIKSDDPAVEDFEGNGFVRNGVIYLSLKEADIAQFTFGHELLHQLKQIDADSYMRIRQKVIDVMGRKAFEMEVKARQMTYANVPGYTLFEDYAEEVIADTLGDIITHTDMLPNIARSLKENPSLLDRFLKVVDNVRQYFRGKIGGALGDLVNDIRDTYEMTARQGAETNRTEAALDAVNDRFNDRLESLVANPNQKDKVLRLGRSSEFLRNGGLADAEIVLEFDKLARKSKEGYKNEHPFDMSDIKDLPIAISSPIAVFDNTNGKNDGRVILTELTKDGRNFIVAVKASTQRRKGGVVLEVNQITSLFPKDAKGIVHWFNSGKATNIDKEKALRFIEALPNHPGTTIKAEELISAANVVKDFVNSKESDGKDRQRYASIGVSRQFGDGERDGEREQQTANERLKGEGYQYMARDKFSLRLAEAKNNTDKNPSQAQKESGNYRKGHIRFGGYNYTIENPQGSYRSGVDENGKKWKQKMNNTYGYILGTKGKDGDHLDMFINDKADLDSWNGNVYVVDQVLPDGSFDEHKVMYGFDSEEEARKAYLSNYEQGWQGLGNITGVSKEDFDRWLEKSGRKTKAFSEYKNVKSESAESPKTGAFGTVYTQFRGKAQEAFDFLASHGSGDLLGVFHREGVGDIDAVWGDKGGGLDHIIRKHIGDGKSFHNIVEAANVIDDIIKTGSKAFENGDKIVFKKGSKLVTIRKNVRNKGKKIADKNWVLTAYDELSADGDVSAIAPVNQGQAARTTGKSQRKDTTKPSNSQKKNVKSNKKTPFSLKNDRTLAGVHNITEEKLLKAIKQGGLANPSVAVIDSSKQNHDDYGDISLILPSDKVAKRTGKNAGTWQGDAWTPTYPQVERQMSNKGAEKASNDVSSVPGDMYSEVRRGLDRWLDGGEENSAMAYMFLHEKGVAPEPKKIQPKFSDEAYNELKSITAGDFNIYGIGKADARKVLDMYIDAKFDGDKDLYEEKTKAWLERNKSIVDAGANGGMRYAIAKENVELYDEYGFNYKGVQTFVRDVEYDHRKTGVDMNATLNEVEDYIKTNNLTDEFNTWMEGKEKEYGIKEVIFDGFTPSGNRRYVPNTLENVSKIMKKQGRNGSTGISVSFQNFAARLMPSYGTLKDIRSKKGLLTSDREKLDKFREKWSNVFFELGMKCQPDATGTFDDYGLARLSEAAMTSDPQAYLKKEYNVDFSDEDTKRLKEMVKAIKEESPAMYFETKFERPVGFDEFSSAVVPTTASNEVKQALQNAGVQIYEYDKEKEGDRSRAFNEALEGDDNIRFSLDKDKGTVASPSKPSKAEAVLRDAVIDRLRENGMEVITDVAEGQKVLDEENGDVREMSFGEPYDYEAYPLGRVEPNLADREVMVVRADADHGFMNYKEAKAWAKQHVAKVYNNEETGGKGDVRISNAAIDKFMSQSAVDKSDDKDVHMSVLKVLPEVLKNSIDVETHPDFLKGADGKRRPENGMNKDVLVHRCYGAVSIDGKPYRVKITLKEEMRNKSLPHNTHSYEATKIELLAGTLVKPKGDNPNTNNSISAAKLLENVVMSYNPGEKVLDASEKRSAGLREQRVYHGSGADGVRFFRTANGEAYGFTVGGKIYVDPRIATSETPVHEYAHLWASALRSGNAEEWQNVVGLMKDSKVWDEVKKRYPELKTDDEIADEVIATYSGRRGAERLREEQRKIAEGDGGVFEKAEAISALEHVKRALKMFWKGVADFLHIHYKSAEEVADRVMKDLLEGVDPRKMGDGVDRQRYASLGVSRALGKEAAEGEPRYQFIGEKGAAEADHAEEVSVRLDNLSVAREMEAEKKDAKAIKMATGWERGADGKWRYEIPDLKEFDRNGNLLYRKHHPDYARYIELQDKDLKNLLEDGEELTDKEREEYEALSKKYESDKFGGEKLDNIHTLEAYVDAPELFKAYPELRNVRVTFKDTGGWETASYYAISDVIDFNVDDVGEIVVNTGKVTANMRTKELKSVFLHEIQHAIQVIEGFAEGGSPQYMKGLYSDYFLQDYSSSQLHELAELRRIAEGKVKRGEYKRMSYAVKNVIKAAKEHGFYPTWAESFDNNPNSVTTVYDTLVKFPSEILDKAVLIDERDLYNRVAGEVEARNVQERMDMSAEERRASLAAETEDVAREDQIFLMRDGVSNQQTLRNVNNQSLFDAIHTLYSKGKAFASQLFNMKFFDVAETPDFMKRLGLTGDKFTIRYGVISRHFGKDNQHDFTEEEWKQIPKALSNPILITEYYQDEQQKRKKGYRLYTPLKLADGSYVVVSAEVKNAGKNLEINAINTIFGRNAISDIHDRIIYQNPKITPEQSSLLNGNNPHQYPTGQELSDANVDNSSETAKESEEKDRQRWASWSLSEQQLDGDDTIRFSLNYDKWNREMASWLKRNRLPKNAQRPVVPQREAGESDLHFAGRLAKYNQDKALWNTAPKYEGHLSSGMTARGEFNYELQRGSVLTRIAVQDSMLAIRKAQEAIARHSGLLKVGTFEDAYMAENNSHGKAKNEFEQYDQEYLEPLRKWFNVMMKRLDGSYNNVTNYMIAKHGLERNAHMAFMAALEAEAKKAIDNTQPDAKRLRAQMVHDAYRQYKADSRRLINDADYEAGKYDYAQWRRTDDAIRKSYCSNYESFRYDKGGVVRDYAGLSSLFLNETDFEEKAAELCADIESKNGHETGELWDAVRQATRQILKNSHDAGMMSDETYDYVRGMYEHYIPLRGWNDSAADEVWDYAGGGRGVFNAALKEAHGRQSLADDPVAYIMNMAESGFLVNNRNWVKQHFLTMAMNHPTDLLTVSKAWYVKTKDQFGNEVWIPASPNIPADETDPAVIEAALNAFQTKMEQMEQSGDATQQRGSLNIEYPQTKSEEREHEVRVMKNGEEYVIYVNGDPQLAQALNNTRAMRVREHEGNFEKACAWLGRKMAAVYTSLSPLFVPSNWARDTTMTLASTAIREDARYNWLLRTKFMRPDVQMRMFGLVKEYQNGKLREKVKSNKATKTEENFWNFMINGGETGFVSTMDVDAFREKIQRDLKDMGRTRLNPVKVGHTIADSVEYINRVIEDSNRFAIYQTSIEYGRGIEEAVQDAKNVTLNFNRKGTGEMGMSAIRQLYLFINPAIQSLQTLGALAKDHKAKFTAVTSAWMASGMLVPLFNELMFNLASAAARGGGDDDDEFNPKDEYWKFSSFDRRNNCILWIPFTHDFIKIPLAQEFRGFYGIGDMVASAMWGGENAKESWSNYAADLMGQIIDLSPLDPVSYDGNVLVSLMPNAIRPLVEIAQNVTFTGKPIYRESDFNKYDPSFKKAYAGTPDFLLRYSKWMNSIGNKYPEAQQGPVEQTAVGRYANNPAVIDHLLKSYLGGMYTLGSQIAGAITKASDEETRKDFKTADIPFFSKFVANPNDRPQSKNKGDAYWQDFEKYQRTSHTLGVIRQDARKTGNFSVLEDFYKSEEYKEMKEYEPKAKQRKEEQKYERWKEEGNADLYQPHQQTGEDVYKRHSTPADDFEDTKASILYQKIKPAKDIFDLADINTPSGMDTFNKYYDLAGKVEEAHSVKKKMNAIVKSFVNDEHKATFDPEKMKEYRALRKQYVQLVEDGNRMFEKIKAQRN